MAVRTISALGGNYNAIGAWVEGVVPTSADTVVCLAGGLSGQLTVNVASQAGSIDFTNYNSTLTMTNSLTMFGNITLVTGMTINGTATLVMQSGGTMTSNSKVWPAALTFQGTSQTYTIADSWTVTTGTTTANATTLLTLNGGTLSCGGSYTIGAAGMTGSTEVILAGTGTWSGAGVLRNPLTFNSSGTITFAGVSYGGTVLAYSAGTINNTGTFTITTIAMPLSIDCGGMSFSGVSINLNATITLFSNLNINGNLQFGGSTSTAVINGLYNINVGGNLTASLNTIISGTATLVANGTGTWATLGASAALRLNTNINTSGTITFGTSFKYNTGILTYVSGTVITTSNTLTVGANTTFNTNGITWNNIDYTTNSTITINSLLSCSGNLSITTVSVIFAGTTGWSAGTFTITTGNQTLGAGLTYTIADAMVVNGTLANSSILQSSSATQAILTLNYGATQAVAFGDATNINSSFGQTIWSRKGSLSNATNWRLLTARPTITSIS